MSAVDAKKATPKQTVEQQREEHSLRSTREHSKEALKGVRKARRWLDSIFFGLEPDASGRGYSEEYARASMALHWASEELQNILFHTSDKERARALSVLHEFRDNPVLDWSPPARATK